MKPSSQTAPDPSEQVSHPDDGFRAAMREWIDAHSRAEMREWISSHGRTTDAEGGAS